jgi:hypothetical protein
MKIMKASLPEDFLHCDRCGHGLCVSFASYTRHRPFCDHDSGSHVPCNFERPKEREVIDSLVHPLFRSFNRGAGACLDFKTAPPRWSERHHL